MTIKQKSLLEQLDINLDTLQDEKIKETIHALFNLIESQAANIRDLHPTSTSKNHISFNIKALQYCPFIFRRYIFGYSWVILHISCPTVYV